MTTRHLLRAFGVALVAGLALVLGAGPAFAHARLVGSDPADGAALATAPDRVSLTFSEPVQKEFTTITVLGPDGTQWQTGEVSTDGPTVTAGVRPLGPAGPYQIGYRIVSDDGHPVTGSVTFTLTSPGSGTAGAAPAPAAAAPTPSPSPEGSGGSTPVWPWIAGAVVLVGAGVVAALRLGRR